jgi:threonine aldolase
MFDTTAMSAFVGFGSDNHSGVHPTVLKYLSQVNPGYAVAYGDDEVTASAVEGLKKIFGKSSDIFFVFNGTGANITGLGSMTASFNSIFCSDVAHLNVHECCGPEKFMGCKLVPIPTSDGKLTAHAVESSLVGIGDPHMAQPKILSLTEATERGTVYTPAEIAVLARFAHEHGLLMQMDGARLSNAAAFLNVGLNELAGKVGVDVLSFGGTKNGMMFGEAVVFFDPALSSCFQFVRKQGMQLASKMRYISAQFLAMLQDDLWLQNARYANAMAQRLAEGLREIRGVEVTQKVEANMVFALLPERSIPVLQKEFYFHRFDERRPEVRLLCSFQTRPEEIEAFLTAVRKAVR